jgi:hypothetical protein
MQRRKIAFTICLGLAVMLVSSVALAQYQLTNLDSNQAKTAKFMDPLQVNGWGLARSSGGPFWVSDQGSGWSTLYTGKGVKEGLEVLNTISLRRRPWSAHWNCPQWVVRLSSAGMARLLPVRDVGRDHQRLGSAVQSQ